MLSEFEFVIHATWRELGIETELGMHKKIPMNLSFKFAVAFLTTFVLFCPSADSQSLAEPDVPTGLYERQNGEIINAPQEDFELAKTYHSFQDKGKLTAGQRITIMTKKIQYMAGEPVRVLHILEAVEPGIQVYIMGPKTIYEEYVDGKLVTKKAPGNEPYDGAVIDRPIADFNYDITTYTFTDPGDHTISWKGGGHPIQGSLDLESNVITLKIVKPSKIMTKQ